MAVGRSSLSLLPEPASVGAARRFVRRTLTDRAVGKELIDTAVLLTSELVTNAVIHTDTTIEVRVLVAPDVRVEVRDESAQPPQRRSHGAESVTGRGLELVEMLASHFGVTAYPPGKIVWFSLGASMMEPRGSSWEIGGPAVEYASVSLRHLPVRLYEVMREHYEALLREYSLAQFEPAGPADGALVTEIAAADRSRLVIAEAFSTWRSRQVPGAVPTHVDLHVAIPAERLKGFPLLNDAVHAADTLARSGQLLTPPPLPELVWLRDWILAEVANQLAGKPPSPWQLPEDEAARRHAAAVDISWVQSIDQAVIVADVANHVLAVSGALTQLLGWEPADLVGRRLTRIIPPRLREAHLAGFSRHQLTGSSTMLDREVTVPALRRDGTEVDVRMRLEKRQDGNGTSFVAWLEPA